MEGFIFRRCQNPIWISGVILLIALGPIASIAETTASSPANLATLDRIDWNIASEQDVARLAAIRPDTAEQQRRINDLTVRALFSGRSTVRNAAGDVLIRLASGNQLDPSAQLDLVQRLNPNWEFEGDRAYLFRIIEALRLLRPQTDEVALERIAKLRPASVADSSWVRDPATDTLAGLMTERQSPRVQLALVQALAGVNWNFEGNRRHLLTRIEALGALRSRSSEIQEIQIRALSAAFAANPSATNPSAVRNAAGAKLVLLAKEGLSPEMALFFLESLNVNWNIGGDFSSLHDALTIIASVPDQNDAIRARRAALINAALRSRHSTIRQSASLLLAALNARVHSD